MSAQESSLPNIFQKNRYNEPELLENYSGILPCSNCKGIMTELLLFSNNTFILSETFLGKKNSQKSILRGELNFERGFGEDDNATVYILNYNKPKEEQYYVRFSHQKKLIKLDKERKFHIVKGKKSILKIKLKTNKQKQI